MPINNAQEESSGLREVPATVIARPFLMGHKAETKRALHPQPTAIGV